MKKFIILTSVIFSSINCDITIEKNDIGNIYPDTTTRTTPNKRRETYCFTKLNNFMISPKYIFDWYNYELSKKINTKHVFSKDEFQRFENLIKNHPEHIEFLEKKCNLNQVDKWIDDKECSLMHLVNVFNNDNYLEHLVDTLKDDNNASKATIPEDK